MRQYYRQLIVNFTFLFTVCYSENCFSCATTNMKSNFLTKQRGPSHRISNPLVFDDNCNSDTWIIKERSKQECSDGVCFKWQQVLNNSGSNTMMTFRGCYQRLFDINNPAVFKPPNHSFCTSSSVSLSCLSDANIIEHSCWCQGNFCNSTNRVYSILQFLLILILAKLVLL